MKRILATLLLVSIPAFAGPKEKPTIPDWNPPATGARGFCMEIKGLDLKECLLGWIQPNPPVEEFKDAVRNMAVGMGFEAANAYYAPPLTPAQERQREIGRKIMQAAPYMAFPDLGDQVNGRTPAIAVCSASTAKDPVTLNGAGMFKATGKGRCDDTITVYLRPAGK